MKMSEFLKELTTIGTPVCGAGCALLGVIIAALLLSIGLWKTLFVAALCLVGLFAGGVKDKHSFLKKVANKLFPAKE